MSSANINTDFYTTEMPETNLGIIDDGINLEMVSRTKDKEFDAIEILVDLARTGKINPWDIDIVDVYDNIQNDLPS